MKSFKAFLESQMLILYHVTPSKNIPNILKVGLIPQIGTRSKDLGEKQPSIFLFPDMDSVENALMNWLGEYFEDEPLSLLQVTIPSDAVTSTVDYEYVSLLPILPQQIKVIDKDL